MKTAVVYTQDNDFFSSYLLEWMEAEDIIFKEKNIEDPIHLAEVQKLKGTEIPLVTVDGKVITQGHDISTRSQILLALGRVEALEAELLRASKALDDAWKLVNKK